MPPPLYSLLDNATTAFDKDKSVTLFARSHREAALDIVFRFYLIQEAFAISEDTVIDWASDYYVDYAFSPYYIQVSPTRIKTALAQLMKEGVLDRIEEEGAIMYQIPAYVRNDKTRMAKVTAEWKFCPMHRPVKPSTKERAYQREKQRQEATSFRKHASRKHWIYYIQWENDPEFVKIGYSSKPVDRVASFLTGSPGRLRLLRLEEVLSQKEELGKHSEFNAYHHRREWFKYEGALKDYIESLDMQPGIELWKQFSPAAKSEIDVDLF